MRKLRKRMLLWSGGGDFVLAYTNKVIALAPIAYWPQAESSGTVITDESGNSRGGTYTNVTLGATGIGDGRTSASYTTGSVGNVFSASLQGAFNGQEGTVALWAQVSAAGVWSDATNKALIELQADPSNVIRIRKTTTANTLQATYNAGGTSKTVSTTSGATGYIHLAVTWSKSGDALKFYLNGAQVGVTQTGLGTFVGSLLNTATALGSASSASVIPWSGQIAHAAIWTSALSAAQITALATL